METTNKLFYSGTKFFTENEEDYRITVRISLDDDCKNNICDWSITADVDWKNKHGKYEDYLGGCCHDEVAKHFPELAKFISLHLCNHYGAPMYPVENGIYHVRRSGMSVAMEYLRISEQECAELYKASEDELYFKYMLFNLGIVNRWKRESEELIAELEKLCGKKWVNPYKPEEERFVLTLTDEERSLIEERIKAGHYSSENIEKRRVEAHKAKMAAKRAEICERYDKKIRQAEAEKKIMLCVFDYGLSTDNVIYYSHTNTLSFNWDSYEKKITQEEFDDFVKNVDRSKLPEGIKFELNKILDMERLNFETLFRVVRWDYNRCFKDESLDKDLFIEKYGKVMGEHYYNKFVHEFDGNILKMVGYFRGSEKEGQVFCDMITERIEKYEKRMSYDKGKLNN